MQRWVPATCSLSAPHPRSLNVSLEWMYYKGACRRLAPLPRHPQDLRADQGSCELSTKLGAEHGGVDLGKSMEVAATASRTCLLSHLSF